MSAETHRRPAHHRLYGRSKGKALTDYQAELMERVYPGMEPGEDPSEGHAEAWLEIGFGAAHHLLHMAKAHPNALLIGAEPFLNGVAKAVAGAHEDGLDNLRLYHGDVRDLLARLPDASLTRIFVLFPDPWPKARHRKRRLIQEDTIAEFARVLKPGGVWRFASDITDYVDWTLTRVARSPQFSWEPDKAGDFLDGPPNWPGTNYEAKAVREGRTPHFFDFVRS